MPIRETITVERNLRLQPSRRDWTSDAVHENGNYVNRCVSCGELFCGHKRRVICHECINGKVVQNVGS